MDLEKLISKTSDETDDQRECSLVLAMETFAFGVADGIGTRTSEAIASPWNTVSEGVTAGVTGLFIGAMMKKPVGLACMYSVALGTSVDFVPRLLNAFDSAMDSYYHPDNYRKNRMAVNQDLGTACFDYGILGLSFTTGALTGYRRITNRQ